MTERRRGKEIRIFTSVRSSLSPGTYFCLGCGSQLSLRETDSPPHCPRCGGFAFRRDSIFEMRQEHGALTREFAAAPDQAASDWLQEARELLPGPGRYLALNEGDGPIQIFPIEAGWTRIGRSAKADIRLDDPSVSRRHALLVSELGKPIRVLDDRSLNGVVLNGKAIEWGRLADEDELKIGAHRLFVLES